LNKLTLCRKNLELNRAFIKKFKEISLLNQIEFNLIHFIQTGLEILETK